MFNVSDFTAAGLPLGGARPSLFTVLIDTPNGIPNVAARITFTCQASSFPESKLGAIDVSYFGRKIPFAGSRTFSPWAVTIVNDEDFEVRHAMEAWSNAINRHEANLRDAQLATGNAYKTLAQVTQYSKTGVPVRTYEIVNIWPVDVSAIALGWDKGDAIETFDVTFAYDFWRIVAPSTTGVLAV